MMSIEPIRSAFQPSVSQPREAFNTVATDVNDDETLLIPPHQTMPTSTTTETPVSQCYPSEKSAKIPWAAYAGVVGNTLIKPLPYPYTQTTGRYDCMRDEKLMDMFSTWVQAPKALISKQPIASKPVASKDSES
jgi:hypothetical protein